MTEAFLRTLIGALTTRTYWSFRDGVPAFELDLYAMVRTPAP